MIFKQILDALEDLRQAGEARDRAILALGTQLTVLREEQQTGLAEVIGALESLDAVGTPFRLTDARMQEGISNLMAFDGRARKGEG